MAYCPISIRNNAASERFVQKQIILFIKIKSNKYERRIFNSFNPLLKTFRSR